MHMDRADPLLQSSVLKPNITITIVTARLSNRNKINPTEDGGAIVNVNLFTKTKNMCS